MLTFCHLLDSSVKEREQKSIQFLQQMVYLAAQAGAQHFIEIVFGTSAGQIVYKSYKDRTPLPEDVARANGHKELAQYLQDINKRCVKLHSEYPASTVFPRISPRALISNFGKKEGRYLKGGILIERRGGGWWGSLITFYVK